jgi:YD repeat-containing protein
LNYQDDFGFLDFPPGDSRRNSNEAYGTAWSLKEITYPDGGRQRIIYESDKIGTGGVSPPPSFTYYVYTVLGTQSADYDTLPGNFNRTFQGGPRVKTIRTYNGYNESSPDSVSFTYGEGFYSGISEGKFLKIDNGSQPFYVSGDRGQFNITYAWIEKRWLDNSKIKTHYVTGNGPEFQIFYKGGVSGPTRAILYGNTRWNWGEIDSVKYFDANSTLVKKEVNYWSFYGTTPSDHKIAAVAPSFCYGITCSQGTPEIYLNFTHNQLDSVVTKNYFGSNIVTSRVAYEYNDGTLLSKTTETSADGKKRITENTYAHDLSGSPYSGTTSGMRYSNMRSQIAQASVKDNNPANNGYASTITTWKDVSSKYLPHKEFHWRKDKTGTYPTPVFDGSTPQESDGWVLTQTFDQYDQHGNLTQVKDANGIATTISWDVASGTLIDSIKTRPNSTLKPLATKYGYDPATFRLTAVTDPNNQKTEYKYDPLQRLIVNSNPDKRTVANHSYYYSRQGVGNNDNFVNTDPNYLRTVASTHVESVRNHDFENGSGSWPAHWKGEVLGTTCSGCSWTWDNTTSFSGAKSIKAYIPAAGTDSRVRWMSYPWYDVKVSPQKTYRMEVWTKTANGYNGNASFTLWFRDINNVYTERKDLIIPAGDRDWTKFTMDITLAANTDHLYAVYLDFISNNTYKGAIWHDRANFYELNIIKTFADGLGRDIQTLQRESSGGIKTGILYDFAGRVSKVTKPFSASDTSFVLDPISAANTWYSQTAGNHPAYYFNASSKEYDTDPYAFAETDYYPDPLNRVKNQYFPGTAFSKNDPDKKYVKNYYTTNAANELGFAANKVLETRTLDENNVLTEIFTDTFGNKAGVRVDSANATPSDSTKLATLFQYNILNNLTKIVPPKAFQTNGNTPSLTSPLCTNLTYNTLGQLTSRQTPDAGTDSSYYDKKGNLRFVKDAKGAAGNYFIYYKYDNLNRKIEEGTTTPASGNFKQSNADLPAYPTTGYTFKAKFQYDSTTYGANGIQRNLRGRLDAIEYVSDRFPLQKGYIFYSYDNNGNVEWIDQYIPTSNSTTLNTRTDYQYDALGKVIKIYFRRTFPPGASPDAFYVWYDYDALGRLEKVSSNTANVKPTTAGAQYTYWPSGQIRRLALGNNLQGMDYLYNSRDWLTQINSHFLLANKDPGNDSTTVTKDRFGEIIGYNKQKYIASDADYIADFTAQFNGNISWLTLNTDWPATNPDTATGLVFKYDKANRLTKGNWGNLAAPTSTNWSATNRYDLTGITYDRNGNLTAMTRRNQTGVATSMTYNYIANTNKLHQVAGLNGQGTNNYVYDQNGNMTKDIVKLGSGSTITYDYRNLPTQVPIQSNTISFGYDGKGQRVSKNNLFYVPGADGRVIAVYDINGTHLYWNIWGLDLLGQRFWKQ